MSCKKIDNQMREREGERIMIMMLLNFANLHFLVLLSNTHAYRETLPGGRMCTCSCKMFSIYFYKQLLSLQLLP